MIRAVIRLRSSINANPDVRLTLESLRLNRVNHCVLIPDSSTYNGMLQTAKDYITWGEIKTDVLTNMIIKRGRLEGDRPVTNQYIKENTKHESLIKFAEAVTSGTYKYTDLKEVKPIFRLHPPRQGFEGIKRSFNDRGSLGYRGEAINDLILKMLDAPAKKKEKPAKKAAAPQTVMPQEVPKKAKPVAAPKKAEKPAEKKSPAKKVPSDAPKKAPAKKAAATKGESK